eukprot:2827356-Prymnesium_polylepis.1
MPQGVPTGGSPHSAAVGVASGGGAPLHLGEHRAHPLLGRVADAVAPQRVHRRGRLRMPQQRREPRVPTAVVLRRLRRLGELERRKRALRQPPNVLRRGTATHLSQ